MKNKLCVILGIIILCFCVNVHAEELGTLVPVGGSTSADTVHFTYNDVSYDSTSNVIRFGSITSKWNKTAPMPVSINILLFDSNKKNIGYLTYCSEKDIESEYSQYTIRSGNSTPFSIKVSKKYFVEGKSVADLSYFAIYDDNEYCHVGGYDNYKDLTIEQIMTEKSYEETEINNFISKLESVFGSSVTPMIIMIVVSVLFVFIVQGIILNALHKRMFIEPTFLSYVPIGNVYITIKMAFGKKIAVIYLILYIVSFLIPVVGTILAIILSLVSSFAFILDIIKLITKKYDLLYLGPGFNNLNKNGIKSNNIFNSNQTNDVNNNINQNNISNQAIDLSYSGMVASGSDDSTNISISNRTDNDNDSVDNIMNFNNSSNNGINQDNTLSDFMNTNNSNNTGNNNSNDNGGSDLSNMFR